jgi:hypothetical protein
MLGACPLAPPVPVPDWMDRISCEAWQLLRNTLSLFIRHPKNMPMSETRFSRDKRLETEEDVDYTQYMASICNYQSRDTDELL